MSVERIAQYISEQVRKERALGLHGIHAFDEATEVHGDPDDDSHKHIDKIHAHIKAAGLTVHHDDDGKATRNPHVTAHYGMGDDRKTAKPSGFTIHKKAHSDAKLMGHVKSFHSKYGT